MTHQPRSDAFALPMQTRAIAVSAFDVEARTIDLVWTTGARVLRYDWYREEPYEEELVVSAEAVDLNRLNSGAPLLAAHSQWSLSGILGVVVRAMIEKGEGRATVRFAKAEDDPDADRVFRKVVDGIIRNVSVGYLLRKVERIRQASGMMLWRVIDWQPYEISFVAVGADAGAGVRSADAPTYPIVFEDSRMSDPVVPPVVPPANPAADPAQGARSETQPAPSGAAPQEHTWAAGEMAKVQARALSFGLDAAAAIEVMGTARSLEEATDALQTKASTLQSKRQNPHHQGSMPPNPDEAKRAEALDPKNVYARRMEATRAAATR
ncbi:hypothetical protein V5G24_23370 [Xanthobacter sp. VTT E-85241]|uniref:hypothetical protein n=1 Tax=Roseixanthobacter finlandensis TaxID=3119922 RepID=UPI00372BC70C